MSRSAFLKYSLQVRIGQMDGIFVAYHNTRRIYGFQYLPLKEMDRILHGTPEMGAQAFKLSVTLLETLLQAVTDSFPRNQPLSLIIEYQESKQQLVAYAQPNSQGKDHHEVTTAPAVAISLRAWTNLSGKEIKGPISFIGKDDDCTFSLRLLLRLRRSLG